jgi:hypothetical protein
VVRVRCLLNGSPSLCLMNGSPSLSYLHAVK